MKEENWKKKKKSWKPLNTRAKNTRYFKKHPDKIGSIMSHVLARHGIARQVMSAMLVQRGNELLLEAIDDNMRPDVRVAWYRNKELFIACRVPAALHIVSSIVPGIKAELERQFKDVTIERVTCRFHPQTFDEL